MEFEKKLKEANQRALKADNERMQVYNENEKGGAMSEDFWLRDEVNLIAVSLDGRTLGAFAVTCRAVHDNLKEPETLRWLASLRGLEASTCSISSIEHLEIAETMAECVSAIFFDWGSTTVERGANASLVKVAKILCRHTSLQLSVEAHCGLEARYAMPLPGQAREFTRVRADAVVNALVQQARLAGLGETFSSRVRVRAWGCARPRVWCFGQRGMGEPVDEEGAALNRRVELYLRGDRFEVPTRRKRSAIPRPPGEPPLEATPDGALDDDDDDGTADAGGDSQSLSVSLPNGEHVTVSAAMLHHLFANLGVAPNDYEDDMASEDDEGGAELPPLDVN